VVFAGEVRENKRKFNKQLRRYINCFQLLELILDISGELKEAYLLKDSYAIFNMTSDHKNADDKFSDFMNR